MPYERLQELDKLYGREIKRVHGLSVAQAGFNPDQDRNLLTRIVSLENSREVIRRMLTLREKLSYRVE